MKFRWDNRYLHWGVTAFLVVAASMLFYYGIFHMNTLVTGIKTVLSIMAPIIYGCVIAFLLTPLVNLLEKKVIAPLLKKKGISLEKRGWKTIRWICVLFSICVLLLVIYALIMMILPQLIDNIVNIISNFPKYVEVIREWLISIGEKGLGGTDGELLDMLNNYSAQAQDYLTTTILPQLQAMLKNISAGVFDLLIFLKNFLIGAIVSIYLMVDKEEFVAKSKMLTFVILPNRWANFLIHAMRFTSKTFGGFISGKLLDSAIIGVLCYIGTIILGTPYALLVSVIIGVTNIIPFFGPYLGAIPSIFLILLSDPIQSLYFAIFVLILQQFDGNILGPKIIGESTGLSSFLVIVSILVGGGLFGVPGMLIGVPVFAVIYAAVCKAIQYGLEKKEMPVTTEAYLNIDCVNLSDNKLIMLPEEPVKKKSSNSKYQPKTAFMMIWGWITWFILTIWKYLKKYAIIFGKKISTGIHNMIETQKKRNKTRKKERRSK